MVHDVKELYPSTYRTELDWYKAMINHVNTLGYQPKRDVLLVKSNVPVGDQAYIVSFALDWVRHFAATPINCCDERNERAVFICKTLIKSMDHLNQKIDAEREKTLRAADCTHRTLMQAFSGFLFWIIKEYKPDITAELDKEDPLWPEMPMI